MRTNIHKIDLDRLKNNSWQTYKQTSLVINQNMSIPDKQASALYIVTASV